MMVRAELKIDASALVALIGQIAELAQREGSDRAYLLSEVQAMADDPGGFFDVEPELVSMDFAVIRAVPSPRLVRLLTTFGGAR
ncbi:hypothetical protein TG4357_03724 [Thalassovita gelatinovora]|uniref:Uncharacterized protein n=1 Tax=Thalassovita gelatinovora TaxID=53501 RepID=A0A0P1FKS1_THAGE|nr:hypothetical protein [Thalassovita gelatinovora]QIZ79058.1 hypothetical protein HFZ77_00495 [Thalassovita gelatinovora]CUH68661.1 hypothetical protein TG4357_03724 [Thalassovita gelatinovora]SEQ56269.1 hypothetical protein SAMN04488043_106185 [Thalassovita gelatinovora]